VGTGPLERDLRAQVAAAGLERHVLFAGHQADVRPYLEAADLYVSSSEREGFGLALVEAMAFELPCVATNIGGHDDVLAGEGTGMLVPPGQPAPLAAAITAVLEDRSRARAMGIAARAAAETRFDVDRMAKQISDALLGLA
jgi:glycosyltransferase involved in cell wall biosynthesis